MNSVWSNALIYFLRKEHPYNTHVGNRRDMKMLQVAYAIKKVAVTTDDHKKPNSKYPKKMFINLPFISGDVMEILFKIFGGERREKTQWKSICVCENAHLLVATMREKLLR